jgi:hypothetical protein
MKKFLFFTLLLSVCISCTDGFEEINTNKNQPTASQPKQLLPNVIFNLANTNVTNSYNFGDIVAQYGGNYEYNELDIYNWGADNRFWGMYKWLNDINDIKKQAVALDDKNYEAISLVLESYTMSQITDAYGYAPYSEAAKGEAGILKPKYDSQEEIYTQLLLNLEKANTLIDVNKKVEGDLLFSGNMLKWKKFCNSLHVRLLMRISNKVNVSAKLNEIITKPAQYPIFQSNADNATYAYSGVFPNISPMSEGINRLYGYNIVIPSTNLVNTLLMNNDPRLAEWIDPIVGTTNHLGLKPGLTLDQIGEPTNYSRRAEDYFYTKTKISSIFMTYSELNFLLAEASQRNLITTATAQTYYNTAVQASFNQWNVVIPTDYLITTAPYNANTEILYTQKWLALYHTGVEAWFDWKRTGKPSFIKAGPGSKNNSKVPRRIMYPSLEQSVNAENNSIALEKMGSDDINVKVWWDNF